MAKKKATTSKTWLVQVNSFHNKSYEADCNVDTVRFLISFWNVSDERELGVATKKVWYLA